MVEGEDAVVRGRGPGGAEDAVAGYRVRRYAVIVQFQGSVSRHRCADRADRGAAVDADGAYRHRHARLKGGRSVGHREEGAVGAGQRPVRVDPPAGDAEVGQGGNRVAAGEDQVPGLLPVLAGGAQERGQAGDVRSCHGGPAQASVPVIGGRVVGGGDRAQDGLAGGRDVDRALAEVGEGGPGVVVGGAGRYAGGGHRDQVGEVEAGRVGGDLVVVVGVVPGGGDAEDIGLGGDGVVQGLRVAAGSPTVVGRHDVHALVLQRLHVVQALDGARGVAVCAAADELAGQQLDVPVHPHHPDAVVADGADGAGDVGAVVLVVHGVGVLVEGVDPVQVSHVSGVNSRVGPDVRGQVGMVVVDAAVDDRHHRLAGAGTDVPGIGRVNLGEPPEVAKPVVEVVGGSHGFHGEVRFSILDVSVSPVPFQGLLHRHPLFQFDLLQVEAREALAHRGTVPLVHSPFRLLRDPRLEFHHQRVVALLGPPGFLAAQLAEGEGAPVQRGEFPGGCPLLGRGGRLRLTGEGKEHEEGEHKQHGTVHFHWQTSQ